ncbi:lysozyme g-like isoform X2 [Gadus morhua]|uniref:lysozyme g-like isoform X2 n=1 Tax=Gadus morhua TaxID=8049 RepID=UPI0011B6BF8A|nr:lysozyme g-like isoform X2 [Gadus morhua]
MDTFGDILKVETTGASEETAVAYYDRNLHKGVTASEIMAKEDLDSMKKYKTIIKNVAERRHVNPALIAGIISRETEAGFSIKNTKPPGWGDKGNAFGLMQIDKRHYDIPKHHGWDSETHLDYATQILVTFIGRIKRKFPSWTAEEQLKEEEEEQKRRIFFIHLPSIWNQNRYSHSAFHSLIAEGRRCHFDQIKLKE